MKPAAAIATLFGIGKTPGAPGTLASLAALPFALGLTALGGPWLLLAAAFVATLAGIRACDIYAREIRLSDPPECVIDELAGQWLACVFAPLSFWGYAAAFLIFRALDIAKPWPISVAERPSGGLGIMLDDIAAGLFAGLAVAALHLAGLV